MAKDDMVLVRMSPALKAFVSSVAAEKGMSTPAYIRQLIMKEQKLKQSSKDSYNPFTKNKGGMSIGIVSATSISAGEES